MGCINVELVLWTSFFVPKIVASRMRANPAQGCAGVCDGVDTRGVSTKGTYTRGHGEIIRRGSAGRLRSAAEWAKYKHATGMFKLPRRK